MAEVVLDFASMGSGHPDSSSVFDASTRKRRDSENICDPIDVLYIASGNHIPPEDLKTLHNIIETVTADKKPGDEAKTALANSEEFAQEVKRLTPNGEKLVGAMAKKSNGTTREGAETTTRIDAFTFNTDVEENPITITIKLKSGKTFAWNMPQEELFEITEDGAKQKIDVAEFERKYKISLPRTNECFLGHNQQSLEKDSSPLELDGEEGHDSKDKSRSVDFGPLSSKVGSRKGGHAPSRHIPPGSHTPPSHLPSSFRT